MTVNQFLKRIFLVEILKGLALTFKMMVSKPVTVQYPKERREVFAGFRGRHAFVRDPKTNKEKCIMCMKCVNICPAQCISLKKGKAPETGRPFLESYEIEALRCIYCGYCVEVCPACALVLTEVYEYCGHGREGFLFTKERLLDNWDTYVAGLQGDTYWNKFWRPDGVDASKMPKTKREQGPVAIKAQPPAPEPAVATPAAAGPAAPTEGQ